MNCIDDIANAEADLRVSRWVYEQMTKDEREDFWFHSLKCDYCQTQIEVISKQRNKTFCEATYQEMIKAYQEYDWEHVAMMAIELKALSAPFDLYPRADMVFEAADQIGIDRFTHLHNEFYKQRAQKVKEIFFE